MNLEKSDILKDDFEKPFEINVKTSGFESLIAEIFSSCDVFSPHPKYDYQLDEEDLRTFVQNILPRIQKYL